MGIDKSRKHYFAGAVDFQNFLAIVLQPLIAEGVFRLTHGDDFSANAQNRAIFDNAQFFQIGTAPWSGLARIIAGERNCGCRNAEREKLPNIGQQNCRRCFFVCLSG